jgi:adenylate kinase family enzyme
LVRRVLVIGAGGSGKSFVSQALGQKLGLPVVHLDREYWGPGWVETPRAEWERRVRELCAADEWVLDGNYDKSLPLRLERAESVVFLDVPTLTALAGVLQRYVRWRGKSRPDLPDGCVEALEPGFVRWVLRYRRTERPRIIALLSRFDGAVVVLTSRRAARRFVRDFVA